MFDLRDTDGRVKNTTTVDELRADENVVMLTNDAADPSEFDKGNTVWELLSEWRSNVSNLIVTGERPAPSRIYVGYYAAAPERVRFIFGVWRDRPGIGTLIYYGG